MNDQKTALILSNLGSPETNSKAAVKAYLKQSLSDPRPPKLPAFIWKGLVKLLVLPLRCRRELNRYNAIWTEQGSPLLANGHRQQLALQEKLGDKVRVELMMRYGNPGYDPVINQLLADGYRKFIILPLQPQNSVITASMFDHIAEVLGNAGRLPTISFIADYHGDPGYIHALASLVQEHWRQQQRQRFLLMSFQDLSREHDTADDPYYEQCLGSANLLATILGLGSSQWAMSFHPGSGSQGRLQAATPDVLCAMASKGLREIDVICPGFSSESVETLHAIAIEQRAVFLEHGGEQYHYIPCLNDRADHIEMMAELVRPFLAER